MFAVQLPKGQSEAGAVFTDFTEAQVFIKQHPGSRFKRFNNHVEALHYASQPVEDAPPKSTTVTGIVMEKTLFRSPSPQELLTLKKDVEAGFVDKVKDRIWMNPRYLLTSGDTPTILHERFRYNVLHLCALKNHVGVAECVLDTLRNPRYLEMLYPEDHPQTRAQRQERIVDHYLNTPEKGKFETPLHFACKFGHVMMVEFLVRQPGIDMNPLNADQRRPVDLVCSRFTGQRATYSQPESAQRIRNTLAGLCYVPIVHSVDETCPSSIGDPIPSSSFTCDLDHVTSPGTVKAIAGPMTQAKAEEFKKLLTPHSPVLKKEWYEIRRSDYAKGFERIARSLAQRQGVGWQEFWDFLYHFADLSAPEGLEKLETHLELQALQIQSNTEPTVDKIKTTTPSSVNKKTTTPSSVNKKITTPSSVDKKTITDSAGDQSKLVMTAESEQSPPKPLSPYQLSSDHSPGMNEVTLNSPMSNSWTEAFDTVTEKLAKLSLNSPQWADAAPELWATPTIVLVNPGPEDECPGPESESPGPEEESPGPDSENPGPESEGSDEEYETAGSSSEDEFEDSFDIGNNKPVIEEFYVSGEQLSRADLDAVRALDGCIISPLKYPHVFQWRNHVLSKSPQPNHVTGSLAEKRKLNF